MGLMDVEILRQRLAELDVENRRRPPGKSRNDFLKKMDAAEREARRLQNVELITITLIRRADILMRSQHDNEVVPRLVKEAISTLEEARHVLGERRPDIKVVILGRLAEAHASRQDWPVVSSICHEGIELVEQYRYKVSAPYLQSAYLRFRVGLYTWGVRAAYELYDDELMLKRAELSKSRAMLLLQLRTSPVEMHYTQLQQDFHTICEQIDASRAREGGEVPEELLIKRRTLWDLLSIQRYRNLSGKHLPEFSLKAVQEILNEDEAIVYYYWLDKKTLLIAAIARESRMAKLYPISLEQQRDLEKLAQFVLELKGANKFLNEVQKYATLLLPEEVKQILHKKKRLLISPHQLLHSLPFHALQWDTDSPYLIQRFAVTYVPNLSSLLFSYPYSRQQHVLAIGICDFHVLGELLRPLKKAEQEIEALKNLYEERSISVTALQGSAASEEAVQHLAQEGRLAEMTCLHFATHGENINSDVPMESHLFLYDSKLDGLEIANWKLKADLVILSACCSGQRPIYGRGLKELPGDDLFGLQAAFFMAGARQILGSLWPVDDSVAPSIITSFHHHISNCKAPDVALQMAIQEYLRTARLLKRQIYYWAPFFLSAVGRPTIK